MADKQIKLKRSSVPGKIPTTGDLDFGEIAINTFDGNMYMRVNDGIDRIVAVGSVTSVDGRTGVVTLDDLYATFAQGALADSALQNGDNVSELINDAGYSKAGDNVSDFVNDVAYLTSAPVDSVDGQTGVVVLSGTYASLLHAHVEADITDLDKYTQLEVDTNISASMTAHTDEEDPHPQYVTPDDLPSTIVGWYTDNTSTIDGAYLQTVPDQPVAPESSINATGTSTGVPVQLGQWLREPVINSSFDWYESRVTFQLEVDSSNNNSEMYLELFVYRADTTETLVATTDRVGLDSSRKTYTIDGLIQGPITVEIGDALGVRLWINKVIGGADPTVTLFMEGEGVTRAITSTPIPTYPAPHASNHEVGGTDQIAHDNISGASGFKSHSQIDTDITDLQNNTISQVADDTTPMLGGNLRTEGKSVVLSNNVEDLQEGYVTNSSDVVTVGSNLNPANASQNGVLVAGQDAENLNAVELMGNELYFTSNSTYVAFNGAVEGNYLKLGPALTQNGQTVYSLTSANLESEGEIQTETSSADVLLTTTGQSIIDLVVTTDFTDGAYFEYKFLVQETGQSSTEIEYWFTVNGAEKDHYFDVVAKDTSRTISGTSMLSSTTGDTVSLFVKVNQTGGDRNTSVLGSTQLTTVTGVQPSTGSTVESINDLGDVSVSGMADNEVLTWNGSVWTNAAVDVPVLSVDGLTGIITLGDLYATTAQGALADSALQTNDNVSELTNDSGYLTSASQPGDNVSSFVNDVNYTSTGDNVSSFTNDAGYISGITGQVLQDLDDVNYLTSGTPTEGNVLTWFDGPQVWSHVAPKDSISLLTDTVITTPTLDQVLSYDGTSWINKDADPSVSKLEDLTDVDFFTSGLPSNGYILSYNKIAGVWTQVEPKNDLPDLDDVAISGPTLDQVLSYDGTSWINKDADPSVSKLEDLTDVDFFTSGLPSNGYILSYNKIAGVWTQVEPKNDLPDLDDVAISGPTLDQVLSYDGTSWINKDASVNDFSLVGGLTEAYAENVTICDCSKYNYWVLGKSIGSNILTPQNIPTGAYTITLEVEESTPDLSGFNTIRWPGGTAPTWSAKDAKYDVIILTTRDQGTTWIGSYSVGHV